MQHSDKANSVSTPASHEAQGSPASTTIDRPFSPLEEHIDLLMYLKTVWEYKRMVIGITILSLIGAVTYLVSATPLYQISMQIKPGITDYDRDIPKREWKPSDMQIWIEKWLGPSFLSESRRRGQKIAHLRAQTARNVQTVEVSLLASDPKAGKAALNEFFSFLTNPDIERQLDLGIVLSRGEIDSEIKDLSNKLNLVDSVERKELQVNIADQQRQIGVQEDTVAILNQQRQANQSALEKLQKQADVIKKNIEQSIDLHGRGEEKNPNRDLTALEKAISLQQNVYYLFQLQDRITLITNAIMNIELEKIKAQAFIDGHKEKIVLLKLELDKKIPQKIEEISRHIESLKVKMLSLVMVERISQPVASKKPVRPRRELTIAVATLLGIFLGTVMAMVRKKHAAKI
jgi:LPS O-antigen subunit length determinant protein (WzzB/FepE family)